MNNTAKNYNYDFEYTELKNLLLKNLPKKIRAFEQKKFDTNRELKKARDVIDDVKFIEYNSKIISFIIIDIDNKNLIETMDIAANLGIEPTIACATDNGCHLFYVLNDIGGKIWLNNDKAIKYLRDIKMAITDALGGDIMGSHRVKGIWRNPLKHEHIYNENLFFNLNDFKDILKAFNTKNRSNQQKFNSYINKTKINNDNFRFEIGNRNNFIFYSTLRYSKNKQLSAEQIFEYIKQLSAELSFLNGINEEEESKLLATARSVYKCNIENRNNTTTRKKEINEGAMGFKKIENLTTEEYKKEVKLRQQLAAFRTKEILESKGIDKMTKIQAALKMGREKELKTSKIINNFITGDGANDYKKKNGTWNYKKIADALKMKPETISKHIKKLEQ